MIHGRGITTLNLSAEVTAGGSSKDIYQIDYTQNGIHPHNGSSTDRQMHSIQFQYNRWTTGKAKAVGFNLFCRNLCTYAGLKTRVHEMNVIRDATVKWDSLILPTSGPLDGEEINESPSS